MAVITLQPDATTSKDTTIISSVPTTNYGLNIALAVGKFTTETRKTLIQFDLSSVPVGAVISSAILTLTKTGASSGSETVSVYRALTDWYEGNVSGGTTTASGSTWSHRNHIGSVQWNLNVGGGRSGFDYSSSAAASTTSNADSNPLTWNLTSEVNAMVNGGVTNRGWWIIAPSNSFFHTFASSDHGTASMRPKLEITYTSGPYTVTPAVRTARGSTVNPTVVRSSMSFTDEAEAVGETSLELVVVAIPVTPAESASAVGATETPTVLIGGETINGGNASAVGATALGGVSYVLTGVASAVGSRNNPTTFKAGGPDVVNPAEAYGETGGLASLVDLALRPAAAAAVGRTVGRAVALRIYPVLCDPQPYLYITDGTVKSNGQLNLLSLIDPRNGYILREWVPNVQQYKEGGTFSNSPQAHGRRLSRKVFDNAIEIFDLTLRGHDQNNAISFLRELFRWQEMASDYWVTDWAERPVYIVSKAAKEADFNYALVHTMSIPELRNLHGPTFHTVGIKPGMENITLRVERGEWCDTPPGESNCVPVSSQRSWTVVGWQTGNTSGGGDASITGSIRSLVQAANGDILAGTNDQAKIYRSTNQGQSWIMVYKIGSGSDTVNAIVKDYQGYLYAAVTGSAAAQGIWKSTNHGTSWTRIKTHSGSVGFNDIAYVASNNTLVAVSNATAGTTSPIAVSWDGGSTWTHPSIPHYYYNVMSVASFDTPGLITEYPGITGGPEAFFGTNSFYTIGGRASRSGFGFAKETNSGQMGNGGLDMAAYGFRQANGRWGRRALWAVKSAADVTDTEIWQWPHPANGSDTFGKIATIDSKLFNVLYVDPTPNANSDKRTIWAGANGEVYVSYNSGYTWSLATSAPVNQIRSFVRTSNGTLIAGGDSGEIYIFSGDTSTPGGGVGGASVGGGTVVNTYSLGMEATCEDQVFVANKSSFSNLTHVFHYNGSTYSELQFATEPPYAFLGTSPAVNKAVYFGSKANDTNVPGGTFSGIVFDISQIQENLTIVWEYWNGSSWATLTVNDSSNGFKVMGVGSVHWTLPTNWATTTVNSVNGYWVRARISAVGSSPVYPIHSNRYFYTPNLPYVEIAEGEVGGDIPAKAQLRWHNRSDDPASVIDLEVDRLVLGLRTQTRGKYFNAYLNISDNQIPYGFNLTTHADASWVSSSRSATNRALSVTHASGAQLSKWNDLITFSIANTVAKDFYGTYRAFVRCYKSGSGTANWQIRVRTSFGSGGSKSDTRSAFPTQGAEWEILDLGQVSIPTTQVSLHSNNLGDELKLIVQGYATSTGSAIILYDLILIPVDEWAVDARAPEQTTSNTVKVQGSSYLDVDSITNPKVSIIASNRNAANLIVNRYQAVTNGPAMLQVEAAQRVWSVAMSYENFWRSVPEIVGTLQLFKQENYLGPRGIS